METRKLVRSGLGSYVIAVPKEWLDRHKLGKGDILSIERQGENLILHPLVAKQREQPKRLMLSAEESIGILTRKLITAYIEGYGEVVIRGQRTTEKYRVICDQIEHLAGYEIVEKQSDRILVQDLLRSTDISLVDTFRKMDMTLRMMLTELCAKLRTGQLDPGIFTEEDKLVNKLHYTIARLTRAILKNAVVQKEFPDLYEVLLLHDLSSAVEDLGDHLKYLAREAAQLPHAAQRDVAQLGEKFHTLYTQLMRAYEKRDRDAAYQFVDVKERLHRGCMALIGKQRGQDIVIVSRRLRSILLTLTEIAKIVRYR